MDKFLEHTKSKIKKWLFRIRTFRNWYSIVFPINRFLPKERVLLCRNGLKLFVKDISSSEIGMAREVWEKNDYGDLPQSGVIVDIGANIGAFVLQAAHTTNARIFALEPVQSTHTILKQNIALNNFTSRIHPHCLALASKNETRQIILSKRNMGGHSFFIQGEKTIPVKCQTLGTFLAENQIDHVDYLKSDCEGGEYEIFLTAPLSVFEKISTIVVELHNIKDRKFDDIVQHLQKMGFTTNWTRTPRLLRAQRK